MSVQDLMPEGFTPQMRHFASLSRTARVYPQGDKFGMSVWLEIDLRERILIGYGLPDEAIIEAQTTLKQLLDDVTPYVLDLLRMQEESAALARIGGAK